MNSENLPQVYQVQRRNLVPVNETVEPPRENTRNRKTVRLICGWLCAAAVCVLAAVNMMSLSAAEVHMTAYADGRRLGYVENAAVLEAAKSALEKSISEITGEAYSYPGKITYRPVAVHRSKECRYLSPDECYRMLSLGMDGGVCDAYILYIDGIPVAANENRLAIDRALTLLREDFIYHHAESELPQGVMAGEIAEIRLVNNVNVISEKCSRSMLRTPEEICAMLSGDHIEEARKSIDYGIEFGVTRSRGAGVTVDAEAGVSTGAGAEAGAVSGVSPRMAAASLPSDTADTASYDRRSIYPELKYTMTRYDKHSVVVSCSNTYEEDESLPEGLEYIKIPGSEGVNLVTYATTYENGVEISCEEVKTEVEIEMHPNLVVRGTKQVPNGPTGSLIWPLYGIEYTISSYFGEVREEFDGDAYHFGIDIEAEVGTPIYAADGGTVIHALYTSSYGNMIMLEHKTGYATYYAHMKDLMLELGSTVRQGQVIGHVGTTGVTTGPHLHFEYRIGTVPVNPLKWLPKLEKTK